MKLLNSRPVLRSLGNKSLPRATQPQPQIRATNPRTNTSSPFSTTASLQKRRRAPSNIRDPRVTAIRYHLTHPLTPRPLHFSRNRHLRHWTIHRAWHLFQRKQRVAHELELERQYNSMRAACEHLRLLDSNGNRVSEEEAGGQGPDPGVLGVRGKEVGRLYRSAMLKRGIWASVPVEYARGQVDFPAREGWNEGWTRS